MPDAPAAWAPSAWPIFVTGTAGKVKKSAISTRLLSPCQWNPLNYDPPRDALERPVTGRTWENGRLSTWPPSSPGTLRPAGRLPG